MVDFGLREELLRRMRVDQAVRTAVPAGEPWPEEIVEECRAVDSDNTEFLKAVIAERGWPGRDLVGEEAAHAAWLLVQHADRDPAFQEDCLEILRRAVEAGQAEPSDLAYLVDRVRVAQDRPQVYGTQYSVRDGVLGPWTIEDPGRLDGRRAEVGLGPHAEYDRSMRDLEG